MKLIWNSLIKMRNQLKIGTFKATIEPIYWFNCRFEGSYFYSILLYGSESWTIDAFILNNIYGCYTRFMRMTTNTSWKEKLTNDQLYKEITKISEVINL